MEEQEEECRYCKRLVPAKVLELHSVHCQRFLCLCEICRELIPKAKFQDHIDEEHPTQTCPHCSDSIPSDVFSSHLLRCELRPQPCPMCTLDFPFDQLIAHQEICANRTEHCTTCGLYVPRRDFPYHVVTCRPGENGNLKRKRVDESAAVVKKPKRQ